MLYDPKWDQQTRAAPRSLESLIAWLEQKDPEAKYDYCKMQSCMVAQWLIDSGEERYQLLSREVAQLFGGRGDYIVHMEPWTFGAALQRARAALTQDD